MGLTALMGCCLLGVGTRAETASSPRDLYNDGTKALKEGKWSEAETFLQGAVGSQNEAVQPPALYNLGETRFLAGLAELKKQKENGSPETRAKRADGEGNEALQAGSSALAGQDVQELVAAYLKGRGSRRDLKAAQEAIKKALDQYGTVLAKWRSAAGDFSGAWELAPNDQQAKTNADIVNRNIAKLVDQQQMLMQMLQGAKEKRGEVGKMMGEIKKRLPKEMTAQSPGKGQPDEDDDDDEDGKQPPPEPKAGMQEPKNKPGDELEKGLGPEEAERLLGMLKLDSERKLPFGMKDTGEPKKNKSGRDW